MSATSISIFTYKHTSNTTLSIPQIHIKLVEDYPTLRTNKYNMIQKFTIVLVYGRLLYCMIFKSALILIVIGLEWLCQRSVSPINLFLSCKGHNKI